ncbi:MAG: hypothetical protein ISS11_08030 [Candidatus Marinimicrobia bacterium]|nr:hypothetical protein [Candidatus Neomarinimicrobiota bacterium]
MNKKLFEKPAVYYSKAEMRNKEHFDLFLRFQIHFEKYIEQRVDFANDFSLPSLGTGQRIDKADFIKRSINYNRFIEYLERSIYAAKSLVDQYDIGIGVAKQGLWLSFIFNLFKMETYDVLIQRKGMKSGRGAIPLDVLTRKLIQGKKVLLFENDIVTGETIKFLTKRIGHKDMKHIDLLLIFRNAYCSESYHKRVRKKIRGKAMREIFACTLLKTM